MVAYPIMKVKRTAVKVYFEIKIQTAVLSTLYY